MPFWILFRWRKVVETFWNSAWQDAGWCSHETIERRNCDINSVTCSVERFTLQPAVGTAGSRYNKHDTSLTQRPDRLRTLTWDKDWQRQRCVRGVKNIYMLEMLGEMILSFCLCLHRANTHTHTHCADVRVRLWLLNQSLSREAERCVGVWFPGTHRVPAPACSWVSGCCGCAGIAPSVGGPSRTSGWDARPVCSGSRTQHRSLLCGTPTWDSWHSPRRWRQIWQEETKRGVFNIVVMEEVKLWSHEMWYEAMTNYPSFWYRHWIERLREI